jgi:hypothetical protein
MDYLWTFRFVWTPILCCGLFVNCVFKVSVLWILYGLSFYVAYIVDEFAVIFYIFFNFFALKLLIFGGLPGRRK